MPQPQAEVLFAGERRQGQYHYSITMHDDDGGYISTGYTSLDGKMTYVAPDNSTAALKGTVLWFFDEGSALGGQ